MSRSFRAMGKRRLSVAAFLVLVLFGHPLAFAFTVYVVAVLDGDTLDVLHNGLGERVRLDGIECLEKGQAFGNQANRATSDLAFEKTVALSNVPPGQV